MLRRIRHFRIICLLLLLAGSAAQAAPKAAPNVLFIFVDDLRPELGCYGAAHMHTPNIDRLAASGVLFSRQFVAAPTCGASRHALLTGQRPSTPLDLSNNAFRQMSRERAEGPESMVELFRTGGYRTVGIGKISHSPDGRVYGYDQPVSETLEMPRSWDEVGLPYGQWKHGWNSFFAYANGTSRTTRRQQGDPAPPAESADVIDTGYPDGLIARAAVRELDELKAGEQPFFLAVGFFKPHLPFNAPQRYWDLYPEEEVDVSPAPGAPTAVHAKLALHASGETGGYTHPKNWRENEAHHRHLRRGYRAAVSYIDAQVGLLLDALEQKGLAKETIVVLWGDHGWHLGDLSIWGKHTLFDWSLHSPLIIRAPRTGTSGTTAQGVVESIDVYPTLADLCGLSPPADLEGSSLAPMLEDPSREVKAAAFSYWNHGAISVRTKRYRLTRYRGNGDEYVHELYDLQSDPFESKNIAGDQPGVVKRLSAELEKMTPDQR